MSLIWKQNQRCISLFVLAAVLCLVLGLPWPAKADITSQSYYQNWDIDDGNWKLTHSTVRIENSQLVVESKTPEVPVNQNASATANVTMGSNFEFEFSLKLDEYTTSQSECGAKIEYGTNRVFLAIMPDMVQYVCNNGFQQVAADIGNEWHTYKYVVTGETGSLYIDGNLMITFNLQSFDKPAPIAVFWTKSKTDVDTRMLVDDVRIVNYPFDIAVSAPLHKQKIEKGAPVEMAAQITGDVQEMERMEFLLNKRPVKELTQPPYTYIAENLPPGEYTLSAVGHSKSGIVRQSDEISFTVMPSVFGQIASPMRGAVIESGTAFPVEVNAGDGESTISMVEVYVNDTLAGRVKNFPYTVMVPGQETGNYSVKAAIFNTDGDRLETEPVEIKVCSTLVPDGAFHEMAIPYRYSLAVDAGKSFAAVVSDGIYQLQLRAVENGLAYTDQTGAQQTYVFQENEKSAVYEMIVDMGAAYVYGDGKYLMGFWMPLSDGKTGASFAAENGAAAQLGVPERFHTAQTVFESESVGSGQRLSAVYEGTQEYIWTTDLEAAQPGGGFSMSLSDGAYPLHLTFAPDGIYADASHRDTYTLVHEKCSDFVLSAGRHTVSLDVSKGSAQVFVDAQWVGSFKIPQISAARQMSISSDGAPLTVRKSVVSKKEDACLFRESFEDGGYADYFTAEKGVVSLENGLLLLDGRSQDAQALLYTYARNFSFAADVKIPAINNKTKVGMLTRWNDDNYYIFAGYDNTRGEWVIEQHTEDTVVVASSGASLAVKDQWQHLEVLADEAAVSLYVDGVHKMTAPKVKHISYGKLGFYAAGAQLYVDNIVYSGDRMVSAGMMDTTMPINHTTDFVKLTDGTVLCISEQNMAQSTDNGLTWEKADNISNFSQNTIRLASGKLLSIRIRQPNPDGSDGVKDYCYTSSDDGKSWDGPYPIQENWSARITMNGKVIQTSTGRVVFVTGESGSGLVSEDAGELGIFYSDNEGKTWKAAENFIGASNTGVNVGEGKAIELPDGTLKLYARTDRGFLYETISTDGGVTWDTHMTANPFVSPLCAFNIERDAFTGDYYMFWTYGNKNDNALRIQHPRTRVALAVSRDGTKTWEFVGDIEEWSGNYGRFMNLGIRIMDDTIFMSAARYYGAMGSPVQSRTYRLDKSKIKTMPRFMKPHIDGDTVPRETISISSTLGNVNVFKEGRNTALTYAGIRRIGLSGDCAPVEMNGVLYIPIRSFTDMTGVYFRYLAEEESFVLSTGTNEIKLFKKSSDAEVNGTPIVLQHATEELDCQVLIPICEVAQKLGLYVFEQDGIAVVSNVDLDFTGEQWMREFEIIKHQF